MANGNYEGAVATLLSSLKENPYNKDVADEETDAAKKAKSMALKKDADALILAEDFSGAAKAYFIAYGLWPDSPAKLKELEEDAEQKAKAQALRHQAQVECSAGEYAKAVATYDEALEFLPNDAALIKERADADRKAKALALKKRGEGEIGDHDYKTAVNTLLTIVNSC